MTSPPLVRDTERIYRSGELFFYKRFIFFHVEENEPKEAARVPLFPVRIVDARRGTMGIET